MIFLNKTHSGKYNLLMNYILLAANFMFPLITYPYVTRVLGAEGLGTISFANSVANYFAAIATFGITSYAVRTCAKIKNDKIGFAKTAGELFTANAVTTAISVILFAITILTIPTFRSQWKFMAIFGCNFALEFMGVNWFYTATEQFTYITIRNIVYKSLSLICVFLWVKDSSDVLIYAGITVFFGIGVNILNYIHARKSIPIRFSPTSKFSKHYHKTKWFFLQSVALTILSNMDVSMLGFLSTNTHVGNYEVALKLKLLLSSLVSSLGNVFLPRLSRSYEQKQMDAFWNTVHKSLRYNCVISLPMMGYFWISADGIINVFCGNEYIYSADILRILMVAVFLVGISTVTGIQILLSIDKEKGLFWSLIAGSAVNFALNLCIVPVLHGMGAAITTVCAEAVILAFQLWVIKKQGIRLPIGAILKKPLVGAFTAFLTTLIVSEIWPLSGICELLVSGLFFAGVYGTVLWLLKEEIFMEIIHMIFGRKNERRKNEGRK